MPEMIAAGLLPEWFDSRTDGSRTLRSADNWIDSRRGEHAEVSCRSLTSRWKMSTLRNANAFERLNRFYQSQWQQIGPMLVGLRRFKAEADPMAERVSIEAYIAPFAKEKYGWVGDLLAPAAPVAVTLPLEDIASVQLLMNGSTPLTAPPMPYHLFAGVKDMLPPSPGDTKGLIKTIRALKATPGYLSTSSTWLPRPTTTRLWRGEAGHHGYIAFSDRTISVARSRLSRRLVRSLDPRRSAGGGSAGAG